MKSQKNLIYQNLGVYWVFFGFQHKQKGTVEFERQSLKSSEWHQRETVIQEMIFPSDIL